MDNWVLIPCHNSSALLLEGLKSILAQDIGGVKLFAINNGSKDNVPKVLMGLGSEHIVVNAYPQYGVSGAWNYGLEYLFNHGADRVLVVNQDVELRPDTYRLLDEQNRLFVSCVSTGDRAAMRGIPSSSTRPHPDFSCYLISRSCYETVGRFDEAFYPAWFEDNDYHIRAAIKGIELVCIDLPFYHYAAGTMKTASDFDRSNYYDVAFRTSRQKFYDKWGVLPGTKQYEEMCNPTNWIDGMYVGSKDTTSVGNHP